MTSRRTAEWVTGDRILRSPGAFMRGVALEAPRKEWQTEAGRVEDMNKSLHTVQAVTYK